MLTDHQPLIVRAATLARRLRVPTTWLEAEAAAGRLPHLRAGRQVLFEPATVERILAERARTEGLTDA